MVRILYEAEELARLVIRFGNLKRTPALAAFVACKSDRRQDVRVKLLRAFAILHPQIDVIEVSPRAHFAARSLRRIISFNPDHVSSTAQTFTSTKPSGSASARIASSV